jgi:hypothetical protein
MWSYIGSGYTQWDAIVSWNRWALELYMNEFNPMHAAYPILYPALWSLIYKIQGTSDIWWTAQLTLFVLPLFTMGLLITLYRENKNITFIIMAILIYPYLIWKSSITGYMDMPVMMFGFLSIVLLYSAELNRNKDEYLYYIYAALLFAGIATIVKQAGFVFLVFSLVYILINIKYIKKIKIIFFFFLFSLLYFSTFLIIYYQTQTSMIGNLNELEKLSSHRIFNDKSFYESLTLLWSKYFSYPNYAIVITPYLTIVGFLLFLNKRLRINYNIISLLSMIFFVIGTLIWIKYFSYDARNSIWVKSFSIVFISINIAYFINKYFVNFKIKLKSLNIELSSIILVVFIMLYTIVKGNEYTYNIQENFQKHLGSAYMAKIMTQLLKDKSKCVEIYTGRQTVVFNYYNRGILNQIKWGGWPARLILKNIEHSCSDGRYFIFGPWDKDKKNLNTGWDKVIELEQQKIIFPIGNRNNLIYYIPPNINTKVQK